LLSSAQRSRASGRGGGTRFHKIQSPLAIRRLSLVFSKIADRLIALAKLAARAAFPEEFMPHNFFWKRAFIEARDHGEPSRAVKSAERRNGINGGARKRSVDGGVGRLCRLRVTLERAARRGLFPRGERPALGTRRHSEAR
jgi:hypothetical protein